MKSRFVVSVLAIGLVAVAPATAHAAPTKDDPDALVVRGVDRYKHADYEGARVAFARAFSLSATTGLLFNLALAEVQSGHATDAVKHFRLYMRAPDLDPDKAEIIRTKWLTRAEAESGLLRVEAAAGTLILVDAELIGATPLSSTVPVSAGEHRVEARRGTALLANNVRAELGVVTPVSFAMPDESAAAASPPTLEARPSRVDQPSYEASRAKLITVAPVGGAAVLAGGVAVLFAISSNDDANRASELRAQLSSNSACAASPQPAACPPLKSAVDSQYSHRDLALGFGIAAGALVATDALLFIFWPRRTQSVIVAPTSASGAMLGWRTQF
jgi:hypothetical protein